MNELEYEFAHALARYKGHRGRDLPPAWQDRPVSATPVLCYGVPEVWALCIEGTPPCGGVVLAWIHGGMVTLADGKRRAPLYAPVRGRTAKGVELYRAAMALAKDLDARWKAPMREMIDLADAAWQRGDGG